MADNKKSFILYCDQRGVWDKLNNEQAGKLIKHILAYVNDENPKTDDFITELAFEPIKQQLKRDLKEWEQTRKSRSGAGKAGAAARWQKVANDGKRISSMAKMAVNVNDNVNVNVTDNVNEKEKGKIFIILDGEKIIDPLENLEYFQVQLNGMQKENSNVSWRAKIPAWMVEHAGEEFKDGNHLKNSFKRYYFKELQNDRKSIKTSVKSNIPKFSGDYSEAL